MLLAEDKALPRTAENSEAVRFSFPLVWQLCMEWQIADNGIVWRFRMESIPRVLQVHTLKTGTADACTMCGHR